MITTERLVMRVPSFDDIARVHEIFSINEVMQYTERRRTFSYEETSQFVSHAISSYYSNNYFVYMVTLKDSKEVIGYCGPFIFNLNNQKILEIAYLLDNKYWKQGYALEAVNGMVKNLYQINKKNDKIYAVIDKKNEASISLAKKIGMKYTQETFHAGRYVNVYMLKRKHWIQL